MPSNLPLPTIRDLVSAANAALIGERDVNGDIRSGSLYNHAIGPTAILFSREADRDEDLFQDIYFNNASGDQLTTLIQQRFPGVTRVLDTYGQGTCTFTRPTTAGGGGSILQGTRIQVAGTPPGIYEVASDTLLSSATLTATIPIQALVTGTGVAIAGATAGSLSLLDPTYDTTWVPTLLTCTDGTVFESAADFRARALQTKLNEQTGYLPQIVLACQEAGAAYVIAFPSQYGLPSYDFSDDFGLNALYVSDAEFQSPPSLIQACQASLESWRTCGADLWMGGVTNTQLTMNFVVSLTDNPARLPLQSIRRLCSQALLGTFGPTGGGYVYSATALCSAITNASAYVQTANVPGVWAAEKTYALGALVSAAGGIQQCTVSGESGLSIPAFSKVPGSTVFDGSATWTCSAYPSAGIYVNGTRTLVDPVLSAHTWPASLLRYTLAFSGMNFYFTGPL